MEQEKNLKNHIFNRANIEHGVLNECGGVWSNKQLRLIGFDDR